MMPTLPHAVDVVLKVLDAVNTAKDPDTGEPIGEVAYGPEIRVDGQVEWRRSSAMVEGKGGVVPVSDGHVMFLAVDLDAAQIVLKKGDKIMSIAGDPVGVDRGGVARGLTIVEAQPKGHYGGVATMVKAYFVEVARGV